MSIVPLPRLDPPAVLIDEQLIDFTTVVNRSRICRIRTNELLTFVFEVLNANDPPAQRLDAGLQLLGTSVGATVGVFLTTNPLSQQQQQ